jgi:hypothetical protein
MLEHSMQTLLPRKSCYQIKYVIVYKNMAFLKTSWRFADLLIKLAPFQSESVTQFSKKATQQTVKQPSCSNRSQNLTGSFQVKKNQFFPLLNQKITSLVIPQLVVSWTMQGVTEGNSISVMIALPKNTSTTIRQIWQNRRSSIPKTILRH